MTEVLLIYVVVNICHKAKPTEVDVCNIMVGCIHYITECVPDR